MDDSMMRFTGCRTYLGDKCLAWHTATGDWTSYVEQRGPQMLAKELREDPAFPLKDFCAILNDPTAEDAQTIVRNLIPTFLAPPFVAVVAILAEALELACSPDAERRTNPWAWGALVVAALFAGVAVYKWFGQKNG